MTGKLIARFFVDGHGREIEPSGLPFDSLCLGVGLFETVLVLSGRPVFFQRHRDRMTASGLELDIAPQADIKCIFESAMRKASECPLPRARMRVSIFKGDSVASCAAVITLAEAATPPATVNLAKGSTVRNSRSGIATHKTSNYLECILARRGAATDGYYDAIMLDSDGNIAEASTANIFLFCDGTFMTPAAGNSLPGVVQAWVIEKARVLNVAVECAPLPAGLLDSCEAAFVTNSIVGLLPVSSIGARPLAPLSAISAFRTLRDAYAATIEVE